MIEAPATTRPDYYEPLQEQLCYVKDGIVLLPHYREKGIFVGPGKTPRLYAAGLLAQTPGVHKTTMHLWPRGYNA